MALANVAVDLASRGRRVLVVDFDLEAPGLDTFDLLRPAGTTPGVIDFVRTYLESGQAPDVGEFVFESPRAASDGGDLWVMPAGADRRTYAATYAQIDWGALYERHDGYLLFEDLKEQWNAFIKPDYVLIDSRTGHSDVGGICTRQLPDSVVILFFPNAQNLRGLTKIVRDIRAERNRARDRSIDLHFVMSNVPDLDDEDKILEENIVSFQRNLDFRREPMMVHRYDSLSLLNQVVFTKERPRSRLAKEYREVTREIIRLNAADRDGALDYITETRHHGQTSGSWALTLTNAEKHLETIEANHSADGEVLYRLGALHAGEGRLDDAAALFTRAMKAGYREPEVYLGRAAISRLEHADREAASRDAMTALQSDHASPAQVRRAISMIAPQELTRVAESPAVSALSPSQRVWIASELVGSEAEAKSASEILRPLLVADRLSPDEQAAARHALSLAAIALGRFAEAIEAIRSEEREAPGMSVHFAFNYGMALWGDRGSLVVDPFRRVVELERADTGKTPWPNYLQCMAISHWAVGETAAARTFAQKAKQAMSARRGREFSCWRYLRVSAVQFADDTDEMLDLIGGDARVTPRFMKPLKAPADVSVRAELSP